MSFLFCMNMCLLLVSRSRNITALSQRNYDVSSRCLLRDIIFWIVKFFQHPNSRPNLVMDCKLQAKLKNTCWPHAVWQKGALMAHIPLLTVMSHVAGEFGCCVRWGKKVRFLVACLSALFWSILLLYYADHVCILIIEHLIMNMRHLMRSNYWRGVNDITSSRRWHNN